MRHFPLLAAVLLVVACGGAPEPEAEDPSSVFDPLTDSLDRAKGVEETLRQNAEELRRRIEEEEN